MDLLGELRKHISKEYNESVFMEGDMRFFDSDAVDKHKVAENSIREIAKWFIKGDFRVHKVGLERFHVMECPRCRRYTPECCFDNRMFKKTDSLCNRCLISMGKLKNVT